MTPTTGSVAVLETKVGAHSGYFLEYLANGWRERNVGLELRIVLPPHFSESLPDSHAHLRSLTRKGALSLHPVSNHAWSRTTVAPRRLRLLSLLPGYRRHLHLRHVYWLRWLVMREVLEGLRPSLALVMSLDDLMLPILLAPPAHESGMAGLLFKPSFHYPDLPHHQLRRTERLRSGLERLMIHRFLRREAHGLLSLDPLAVSQLREDFGNRVATLPEPARGRSPDAEEMERLAGRLGLGSRRRVFLMLGALSTRRGIHEVLAAFRRLEPESAAQTCLLLAGTVSSRDRRRIEAALAELRHTSEMQIILDERRIPERDLMVYFHLADFVLVTHRHHVGSSGTLLHAAAAGRPAIATSSGLIGEMTRRHKLGLAVDSASPPAIAAAVYRCLTTPQAELFDSRAAAALAAENTPERYANVLIDFLISILER